MNEVKFDVVELQKIHLKFGDVLSVKLVGDNFDQSTMESLRESIKVVFPENKIMIFTMPTGTDILFEAVTKEPVSYCADCNCGKKENNGKN